ncbi:unnamed protein product [Protopolystoma xenopodis]|uniref:Uncharacterized protein n=1 Tax=Protopolystoma xenopodis TaxID=117903 RepID=A0A3S5A2Q1_9PLAT|nr:unnamed protein product [Protopolystoma xenopodis]
MSCPQVPLSSRSIGAKSLQLNGFSQRFLGARLVSRISEKSLSNTASIFDGNESTSNSKLPHNTGPLSVSEKDTEAMNGVEYEAGNGTIRLCPLHHVAWIHRSLFCRGFTSESFPARSQGVSDSRWPHPARFITKLASRFVSSHTGAPCLDSDFDLKLRLCLLGVVSI